jgi:plastocyanin
MEGEAVGPAVKTQTSMMLAGLLVMALALTSTTSIALPPQTHIIIESASPYFVPSKAYVTPWASIRWENPTPTHHTITHDGCVEEASTCAFESGTVEPNGTYTLPGLPAGQYTYHCRVHPIMRGVLTVTEQTELPSQT